MEGPPGSTKLGALGEDRLPATTEKAVHFGEMSIPLISRRLRAVSRRTWKMSFAPISPTREFSAALSLPRSQFQSRSQCMAEAGWKQVPAYPVVSKASGQLNRHRRALWKVESPGRKSGRWSLLLPFFWGEVSQLVPAALLCSPRCSCPPPSPGHSSPPPPAPHCPNCSD